MKCRMLVWALVVLLIVGLSAALFVKSGGCDREPPDEPVPACEPGDETCKVGAPTTPDTPPIGGAS